MIKRLWKRKQLIGKLVTQKMKKKSSNLKMNTQPKLKSLFNTVTMYKRIKSTLYLLSSYLVEKPCVSVLDMKGEMFNDTNDMVKHSGYNSECETESIELKVQPKGRNCSSSYLKNKNRKIKFKIK